MLFHFFFFFDIQIILQNCNTIACRLTNKSGDKPKRSKKPLTQNFYTFFFTKNKYSFVKQT